MSDVDVTMKTIFNTKNGDSTKDDPPARYPSNGFRNLWVVLRGSLDTCDERAWWLILTVNYPSFGILCAHEIIHPSYHGACVGLTVGPC